jgi:DNA modification methylase
MTKQLIGSLELNRIYQRDCIEGMRMIPDKSVDMILCDLPYGTTQNKWDSVINLELLWEQYKRIIKDCCPIILTSQTPFDKVLGSSNLSMLRYEWIWIKDTPTGHLNSKIMPMKKHENILVFYDDIATAKGKSELFIELRNYFIQEKAKSGLSLKEFTNILENHMASHYFTNGVQWTLPTRENYKKLQSTGYFNRSYEDLLKNYEHLEKEIGDVRYNPQGLTKKDVPTIRKGRNGNGSNYGKSDKDAIQEYTGYPHDVLFFSREVGLHPTQKPVALFEYLIKTYSNEGDIVLDNCMGSGTTAVACVRTNRNFIGFETEPSYVEIANKRLDNESEAR